MFETADSFEIATGHVSIETRFDGRRVSRVSYREGHTAGRRFYDGFRHGSIRRFNKLWSTFFKPLNNLKKWLTRLRMPALFAGLAGSALALVPAVAQLGSVAGAMAGPAFLSWATSIGIVRALLGRLNKSIKSQTMKAIDGISQGIKDLAVETAKPGLNAFFEEAIQHAPILNRYVRQIAGHVSDVGFALADVLDKQQNIQRIRFTLDQTAQATGVWYSLLDEAAEVIIAISSAGAPLFLRFSNQMERVGQTIHHWIMLKTATGELQIYLNNAYRTLEKFGRGGRDFLIGLFNIINGGVFGAEKIGDSFEQWGAAFREWTTHTENIDKIRRTIAWFVEHVGHFFRFAAAATAVQIALMGITRIKGMALFVRTLIGLGPAGFILFGIGAALSSLAGGFVIAFTHSEEFRRKLGELWTMIKDRLGPIIRDWWKWMKEDLFPLLEELAVRGIGELKKSISGLLDTIDDNKEALKEWRPVILFLVKALSYLTGFAIKGFIEELGGLIQILGWVGRGIKLFRQLIENMPGWIGNVINAVTGWFSRLKERAGEVVSNTAAEFRALPGKIERFLKSLPGAMVRSMNAALDGLVFAVGFGLGKVVDFFVRLPGRVITTMDAFWDRLYEQTKKDIGTLVDFFARLPGRVMRWFDRTWDQSYDTTVEWLGKIRKFVGELPGKLISALFSMGPKVKTRFTETWQGAQKESGNRVAKFITWASQIPQRVWKALVALKGRLVNRFAEGWAAATGQSKTKVAGIINFVLGIPGRVFNALRALAGKLVQRARDGWAAFRTESGARIASFIVWVSQIPGRVVRGLGKIGSRLVESGRQLMQGLLVGVKKRISEIGGLGGWFKANLVDPVVNAVKRFFDIRSPSKVFQGIGMQLVAGLWKGVASKNPSKMIKRIFGSMPDALVAMVQKGIISLANLPQKALAKLGGLFDDLFGGGGGGSASGLVGFAKMAFDVFSKAFGLPIGGWRARGSVPGSDHPKGKALDIMTTNPLLHRLIIEMGKRLPGAKYWISMRQIAMAREGWRPRPYSGPSPHTDHVHWSFFDKGGRLPENIIGFGKSGRGYVLHQGETVVPNNSTSIGHQGNVVHVTNYVTIDPKNIGEMNKVIDLMKGIQTTARMHSVPGRPRVA